VVQTVVERLVYCSPIVFDTKYGKHTVTAIEAAVFLILSLPLWLAFASPIFDWPRVRMNLSGFLLFVIGWILIRLLNRKAARLIEKEFATLPSPDRPARG
jgi:hypothetical protein